MNPRAAEGCEADRVAQIQVTRADGSQWRGSGYRISTRAVLTAAHVVAGAAEVTVRLDAGRPGEWQATATVQPVEPADGDVALLDIEPPEEAPAVRPAPFGRLGTRRAVIGVHAVGFPRWKMRTDADDRPFRDMFDAEGSIAVYSNRRSGTLEFTVAQPPPEDPDPEASAWDAMSGAAVWADRRIIGVIVDHHQREGVNRLAAAPVEGWRRRVAPDAGLPDVLPPPPGGRVRAGYVALWRELVPADGVRGREQELDDLAAFCAGDDAYGWWQGEPFAGKSTLMAAFAADPPDGVDVVAFFVNALDLGQSDSHAYASAVADQLDALLGAESGPAPGLSWPERLSRLLSSLASAAQRCDELGRRLLLLVDGVDEDRGAVPSVLSLLPKAPPPGLRVLVVGRPRWTVPADVPFDHPVRRCEPRRIDVSPHATEIARLARLELGGVLGDDDIRKVIGTVAVSGGGLTLDDLEQITGLGRFALSRIVTGTAGRTLAERTDDPEAGPAISFTHQELLAEAVGLLGAGALAGCREAIHVWTRTFQQNRWPDNTPAYALRTYPLMLRDAAVDRLDDLFNDPDYVIRADVDRLLQVINATSERSRRMTGLLRRIAHLLPPEPPAVRAALLRTAAYRNDPGLLPALDFRIEPAWKVLWSDVPRSRHQPLLTPSHVGVLATVILADGRTLVAAGGWNAVRVSDIGTGATVRDLTEPYNGAVEALAFHQHGDRVLLASAGQDNKVRVHDVATGELVSELLGHDRYATGLVWLAGPSVAGPSVAGPSVAGPSLAGSAGLPRLVSGSMDGTLRCWDLSSGTATHVVTADHAGLTALTIVPTAAGPRLVSAGRSNDIALWDPVTFTESARLTGHRDSVRSLATCRLGNGHTMLISGASDWTVRCWDPDSGTETSSVDMRHDMSLLAVARLDDDRIVFATDLGDDTGFAGPVGVYTIDGTEIGRLGGHFGGIGAVAATRLADGRLFLVSGGGDVRLWDLSDPDVFGEPAPAERIDDPIAVLRHRHTPAVVAGRKDGSLVFRDLTTGEILENRPAHGGRVELAAVTTWLTGAPALLTSSSDGSPSGVAFWDCDTGELLKAFPAAPGGYCRESVLMTDPDGRDKLVSNGGGDFNRPETVLRQIDVASGDIREATIAGGSMLTALASTRWGDSLLAVGDHGGAIRVWNNTRGRVDLALHTPTTFYGVHHFAFVHLDDGRLLLVATAADIRVWDVGTGTRVHTLGERGLRWNDPAITRLPDGRHLLVTGTQDGDLWTWNLETGELLARIPLDDAAVHVAADAATIAISASHGLTVIDATASLPPPTPTPGTAATPATASTPGADAALLDKVMAEAGDPRAACRIGARLKGRGDESGREWLRKAALAGDAEAALLLGDWHAADEELEVAGTWWRRAVDAGSATAALRLALGRDGRDDAERSQAMAAIAADSGHVEGMAILGRQAFVNDDEEGVGRWLHTASAGGDLNSRALHGLWLFDHGEFARAEGTLERAAEAGHARAATWLGRLHRDQGRANAAERWFRAGATGGDPLGAAEVGLVCRDRDEHEEAARWLRVAAEAGHAPSMYHLALDRSVAGPEQTDWLFRAAKADHAPALVLLGAAFWKNQDSRAEAYFHRAAQLGYAEGMYNYGSLLSERDPDTAEPWLRAAAGKGMSEAWNLLGVLAYEKGDRAEAEANWAQGVQEGSASARQNLAMIRGEPEGQ
ncbi:trypsin-like peptidase domain-containing protein [Actinoplanes sp. CA-142083]|uniref:trypsin-like peptidase domain-containing protein n=1 Tax=Actinoplanes sp. CA-142083 TaxID=3239903 RepID=UPI003D8A7080